MLVDLFYRGSFWVLLPDRTAILLAFYATTISCLQETVILYDSHFLLRGSTIITCLHIIKWLLEEKTILGKLWSLSSGKDNMVILLEISSITSSKRIWKEKQNRWIKKAIPFISKSQWSKILVYLKYKLGDSIRYRQVQWTSENIEILSKK